MRSYALAIAASMLLAAVYVYQNVGEVTVSFLIFQHVFPQGVWEVLLFSVGAVLMWLFSIFASLEIRSGYRAQLRDRDKKIHSLEVEKASLISAIGRVGIQPDFAVAERACAEPANVPAAPASVVPAPASPTAGDEAGRVPD